MTHTDNIPRIYVADLSAYYAELPAMLSYSG
jgi:hypothetical protein